MFVIIDMFQQTSVKFLVWTAGSWTIQDGQNVSSDDFFSSCLFKDPNTKRFKQMLLYFNTDTQYVHFQGNPLYQATKQHVNNI